MGFPFLAGFITKTWIKYDIPFESKAYLYNSILAHFNCLCRLIFDRVVSLSKTKFNQLRLLIWQIALNDLFQSQKLLLICL
ncbi:MAG: hypothetical protein CM15mP39_04740 [Synechococcus sp.]|nr:MAG: hypothetical protein CM15mP39_04740 [Synechococcus sp.]